MPVEIWRALRRVLRHGDASRDGQGYGRSIVSWWLLPNQVEAEGRGLVTQFDQLPLPAHVPVASSPARDGKGLRGRRAVQELRRDVPAWQGVRHRAVLLRYGHVEDHAHAPVVPDLGAAIGGEHQVMQDELVSLTGPGGTQVEEGVLPNELDEELEMGGPHRRGNGRRCGRPQGDRNAPHHESKDGNSQDKGPQFRSHGFFSFAWVK